MKIVVLCAVLSALANVPAVLQQEAPKSANKQFLITLKLDPKLTDKAAWTPEHEAKVGEHFRQLQDLKKSGKLILAGRTLDETKPTGIVVVEVESEDEARRIMEEDAAVKAKIMSAELAPFRVALSR